MSSNIGGKLDLTQLVHVKTKKKNKAGEEIDCLVIPIQTNNLFQGEKGNVYLDLIAFPLRESKDYATHLVKQSLPKDVRGKMSKEDQDKMPIFGNLKVMDGSQGAAPNTTAGSGGTVDEESDLPF